MPIHENLMQSDFKRSVRASIILLECFGYIIIIE